MHRISTRLLTLAALLMLAAGLALPVQAKDADPMPPNDPQLDGQWEGELTVRRSASDEYKLGIRLTLDNADVKVVREGNDGEWAESMPGLFRISRQGSNAVIQGSNPGIVDGKGWIETWVFVVTCQSENKMRVQYTRLVNNVNLRASDSRKTFAYGGSGMLTRLQPKRIAQADDATFAVIEITAEESGNYHWQGKSLTGEQLETALFAEIKRHPIREMRLLQGKKHTDMERLTEFISIAHAIGAKARYELDGKLKEMFWEVAD